ncbi:hypothetical protein EDC04DRAFT_2905318 [Pisolithus marmoratus]|nr:hypothetical protein EDC04DRAFT_2905318 [Pisolithus marmoratus]
MTMMILLTETILFYWDCIDSSLETDKQKYSGIGAVTDWADKITFTKPLHTLLSQHSAASSHYAQSIPSMGVSSVKLQGTPASTHSSTCPSTPVTSHPSNSAAFNDNSPYLQGNDNSEHQVMPNPSMKAIHHRTNAMAITDVVSSSELDESKPSPLPPSQYSHSWKSHFSSGSRKVTDVQDDYTEPPAKEMDDNASLVEMKRGVKWAPHSQVNMSSTASPPSKQMKMPCTSSSQGSQCSGSGTNKKYINSDIPAGAMNDNMWQQLFILTLAHFTAGYDNPWTIPNDRFKHVLQEIWDTVYWDKVAYTMVIGGPAKQGLNNWQARFAAATVAVITTFFAHDADFDDPMAHMEFFKAMLQKNQFLFSQNRGTDNRASGHTDVLMLNNDFSEPHTALALASAAVCHTLSLIAKGHMSFKITQPSDVWTAIIPKGGQFEFGEAIWGTMTRCYLEPIKRLAQDQFELIVDDTQKFIKKVTLSVPCTVHSGGDDEFEDLFTFQ